MSITSAADTSMNAVSPESIAPGRRRLRDERRRCAQEQSTRQQEPPSHRLSVSALVVTRWTYAEIADRESVLRLCDLHAIKRVST